MRSPVLYIETILSWADAFHARSGRWPRRKSGRIPNTLGVSWCSVDQALKRGWRGLPGGSSLAKLLAERRGVRHKGMLPHYTGGQIVTWAEAHHRRTGDWPGACSGPIPEAPGETWMAVDRALTSGNRGCSGGSSLAQLLADELDVRNRMNLPPLSVQQVLAWADEHRRRTGRWPIPDSGPIPGAPLAETWATVSTALIEGTRGLHGYGSLARFLAMHRGARNRKALPKLKVKEVLSWADAHFQRTGAWPRHTSGPIPEAPGETWMAVEAALKQGNRGFRGGSSLYQVLVRHGRIKQPRGQATAERREARR
jgi:hypothetical protein